MAAHGSLSGDEVVHADRAKGRDVTTEALQHTPAATEPEAEQAAAPQTAAACLISDDAVLSVSAPGTRDDGKTERTRREWLLLGERVFTHPRYAMLIVAALGLCVFEHYAVVLLPLAVFFSTELGLRFWLQRERGFTNRAELGFLALDAVATLSLLLVLVSPGGLAAGGMYLRLARLLRGMYMLRMLRIFRFLTYETLIYSMALAVTVLSLTLLGVLVPVVAPYAGAVLIIEAICRVLALLHTLDDCGRRRLELGFAGIDLLTSVALLGVLPEVAPAWALLRAVRFIVMLDPLGNLWTALLKVSGRDEVRKETGMLIGVFVLLMSLTAMAVLYLYPHMDLSGENGMTSADYAPWQVILYSFRILLDPGNAPADAFSPLLAVVTMVIVLSGVFFFALFVGLGSNVMHYLLEELANSPLSAREALLVAGWSKQALPVLRVFDQMCGRMRRSFASAWIFFGEVGPGAGGVGRWLSVRRVEEGERGIISRFRLSGIRFTILFQPRYGGWRDRDHVADMHALVRDGQAGSGSATSDEANGVVVCDAALPDDIRAVYDQSLGMQVLDSASLKARMLYQMHHCAHMPELGARLLDVVNGETGLYAVAWDAVVCADDGGALLREGSREVRLEDWLTHCFDRGINLLAGRTADGDMLLFGDLGRVEQDVVLSDVVGIGRDPSLWTSSMRSAMSAQPLRLRGNKPLKDFEWPETWDISMIFLGWHDGLPAMIEEMAERHHKMSIHVLFPGSEKDLELRRGRMQQAAERAGGRTGCKLEAGVYSWYGFSADALLDHLKGCKVIMLYPEDASGGEDSLLEMWFHEVARLLDARKARVKWWTPPKLMVLPRDSANVAGLRQAALGYPRLDVDVGSPDSFHDVFMARQLLSRALYHGRPEHMRQEQVAYEFMQQLLGDAVILDGVNASRLLGDAESGWAGIYREAWRRGWMLTAYLLPPDACEGCDVFQFIDRLFPAERLESGSRMHLLGGAPPDEMDVPLHAAKLLFCRRGILQERNQSKQPADGEASAKVLPQVADKQLDTVSETPAIVDAAVPDASFQVPPPGDIQKVDVGTAHAEPAGSEAIVEADGTDADDAGQVDAVEPVTEQPTDGPESETIQAEGAPDGHAPAELAKEGEVMQSSVWPETADKRLLMVLKKQVEGALDLLNSSTEDGLVKLTDAMDRDVEGVLADDIMAALTDFQNIDRVMQRLRNVESCLNDWGNAQQGDDGQTLWKDEVEKRYVMEEERQVLRSEL